MKTGINYKIKRTDTLSLKDRGFGIFFPFSFCFLSLSSNARLVTKIFLFFIRLQLIKPPAMVSGPAGNSTQFWSGGGRLLNDGDESDVKACNSRAHTHTHTHNTKMKIIYLFTSLVSGMYSISQPGQEKKLGKELGCHIKKKTEVYNTKNYKVVFVLN